jgi:uncharacterized membrane protein
MFDLIAGIPIHPLVVHAVVVLFPIFSIYLTYSIYKGKFIRQQGLLLVCSGLIAGFAFLANQSGEVLASRVGLNTTHALYGKLTTVLSAGIFFLLLAYWVLGPRISRSLQKLVRLGLFLAALASLAMIFLAGHSGAKSAWEKKIAGTHVGDHPTE